MQISNCKRFWLNYISQSRVEHNDCVFPIWGQGSNIWLISVWSAKVTNPEIKRLAKQLLNWAVNTDRTGKKSSICKYRSAPAVVFISGNLVAFKLYNEMSSNTLPISSPFHLRLFPDLLLCRAFTYVGGLCGAAQRWWRMTFVIKALTINCQIIAETASWPLP